MLTSFLWGIKMKVVSAFPKKKKKKCFFRHLGFDIKQQQQFDSFNHKSSWL